MSVASQAAKDMLETNIHQLKHLFSPAQVVIEKTENNAFQDSYQPNQQQESMKDSDTKQETDDYNLPEESEQDQQTNNNFSEILTEKKESEDSAYH